MFHQTSSSADMSSININGSYCGDQENNRSKLQNGSSFLELMESMGSPSGMGMRSDTTSSDQLEIMGRKEKGEIIRKKKKHDINKGRYAFQTRSQVDILDDGYRWRKYGQKSVKNTKFPRSYYRCTNGGCKVKKQVQRLSKDEGVVVTTYEGTHSHPIQKSSDNFEHILTQMQIYTTTN